MCAPSHAILLYTSSPSLAIRQKIIKHDFYLTVDTGWLAQIILSRARGIKFEKLQLYGGVN